MSSRAKAGGFQRGEDQRNGMVRFAISRVKEGKRLPGKWLESVWHVRPGRPGRNNARFFAEPVG